MLASKAINKVISGAQNFGFHFKLNFLPELLNCQFWDLFSSGLDKIVKPVAAGLQSLFKESYFPLVAFLLCN
jgi:hypothetical protein